MNLTAISFNIRCIDDPNGHSIPERAPRLHATTAPHAPDVIGFQEYRPAWEEQIERLYGAEYAVYNRYRSTEDPESAPILWRKDTFDCLKQGCFWLSDTPAVESMGWDELGYHRICAYVVLKHRESGECFTFMNTHFGFGDEGQVKSARLIEQYSKQISDFPTLVVGDFNMKPTDPAYRQMTTAWDDVNVDGDPRNTYHGYVAEETDMHIDYGFVRGGFRPQEQTMLRDTFDGKFPSDHYGLLIRLTTE